MVGIFVAAVAAQLYNKDISIGFAREVAIAPPLSIAPSSKFKVSIFNGTKEKVNILSDKCSWGYESMSFELKSPSGKVFTVDRVGKSWFGNVPTGDPLDALGIQIRKIDFADKTWKGFPAGIAGSLDGWQVRVKLTVETSKMLRDSGFWTGSISSGWTEATMRETPVKTGTGGRKSL